MNKKIKKLGNCLKSMKKCLEIPKVGSCVCFSDAFKILILEANELSKNTEQITNPEIKKRVLTFKKEIGGIQKIIAPGKKECIGCNPCIASVVFKAYPDKLDNLYLGNEL